MATVDVSPSYEECVELLRRWRAQPPSENEVNTFLEQAISSVKSPGGAQDFRKTYQDLTNAAVRTDNAFAQVTRTLGEFAVQYQSSFPELAGYSVQWQAYKTRWDTHLKQSRDLAAASSLNYREYDLTLKTFAENIVTDQDVKDAVKVLREFSKSKPPAHIPDDLAQKFLALQRDIAAYQRDFVIYLERKGVEVTAQIATLTRQLDALQSQLSVLNRQVKDATLAFEIASLFGLIGSIVAGTVLAVFTAQRNNKANEVDAKRAELERANQDQRSLAYMKTSFEALDQSFQAITASLSLFANVWQDFHIESGKFADALERLPNTTIPRQFTLRVQLAREISSPLRDSLDLYARTIQ